MAEISLDNYHMAITATREGILAHLATTGSFIDEEWTINVIGSSFEYGPAGIHISTVALDSLKAALPEYVSEASVHPSVVAALIEGMRQVVNRDMPEANNG